MSAPTGNQRWLERAASYRPPAERIDPSAYEVAAIGRAQAKAFIERHHYSASCTTQRYQYGLHRAGELVGVAQFSQPCNNRAIANHLPDIDHLEAVELGRFVLLEDVPGNGESWFLARCFELLRAVDEAPRKWDGRREWRGVRGVISFSDPQPRVNLRGDVAFVGHIGTIYQASNAAYLGRGTPRKLNVFDAPDGRVLSFNARAASKIRNCERGWRYAAAQLIEAGADALPSEDPAADQLAGWLAQAVAQVTRPVRHQGNHRYAWVLDRKHDRRLWRAVRESGGRYPKVRDAA